MASSAPVGLAGVGQRSDPVIPKRREAEDAALDPLDQVPDRFSGSVGDIGRVPADDLVLPSHEGAG